MKDMAVTELYPRLHDPNAPPPPPLHPHHVPFYPHHPAMGVSHHQYFPGTPPVPPTGQSGVPSVNDHHQWQHQTPSAGHGATGYQGYHSGPHHQMFSTPTSTLASLDSASSLKRPYSDASDGDDGFSDSETKPHDSSANTTGGSGGPGAANNTSSSGGSGASGGGSTRKKRRGIIEKRRRDRINNSLSELRRLVPAAFEKQGSAKLEKAEILQMTVDHLKMLHAKGLDALAYDPHKIAVDYHSVGFRECAAEVARYLVAVEGMDIQDPLRLRLMSHLQCFSAQRDLANKSASSWGFNQHHNIYAPPPFGTAAAATGYGDPHAHHHHHHSMSHPAELLSAAATSASGTSTSGTTTSTNGAPSSTATSGATATSPANASSPYNGANNPGTPMGWNGGHQHAQPTALNFNSALSSSAAASAAASEYALNAQMKPYRPWGAELAY